MLEFHSFFNDVTSLPYGTIIFEYWKEIIFPQFVALCTTESPHAPYIFLFNLHY